MHTTALRCPDCSRSMEEQQLLGLIVDVCSECQGVWFDHGELAPFLRHIRGDATRPVPSESQFRVASSTAPELCTRCDRPTLSHGVMRVIPFLVCSSCQGLFLSRSAIERILSERPRAPVVSDPVREAINETVETAEVLTATWDFASVLRGILDWLKRIRIW